MLTGIAGCPPTREEVCSKKLIEFRLALEKVPDAGSGREKREDEPQEPDEYREEEKAIERGSQLNEDEQKYWSKWSQYWLEKLQLVLDIIEGQADYASARRKFSNIANMLVIFHGRALENNPEKMRMLADDMLFELDQAEQVYCRDGWNATDAPAVLDGLPSPVPSVSGVPVKKLKTVQGKQKKNKPVKTQF